MGSNSTSEYDQLEQVTLILMVLIIHMYTSYFDASETTRVIGNCILQRVLKDENIKEAALKSVSTTSINSYLRSLF